MYELSICYNKLWKLLIDKKISHSDLRLAVDIAYSTMGKLKRDEVVSLEILLKICSYLDCNVGDVLDFVKTEKTGPVSPTLTKRKKRGVNK
jgi:DNA-binding Xre family transcriptional regulator